MKPSWFQALGTVPVSTAAGALPDGSSCPAPPRLAADAPATPPHAASDSVLSHLASNAATSHAAIVAGGHRLLLLPQKAALLPDDATLLVADAHIGKAQSFRRLGVPVPSGTTAETLAGIGALIERHGVCRVVFLGDFLHSRHAHAAGTMATLARWRARHHRIDLLLVRGNHDDRAGDPPAALGFEVVDEPLRWGGLALCHHPRRHPGAYVLAGHLHPCVHLAGRAGDRLRLPCFHMGAEVGVLPAFGAFTGMYPITRATGDRVYALAEDSVLALQPV